MDLRCSNCLIKEDTRLLYDFFAIGKDETSSSVNKVVLNDQGICQYCELYKKNFDKKYLESEIEFFTLNNNQEKYHSIVALSGGKDSICALYLAKKELNLNVIAMTYDNGFIPKNVIEQSRRICDEIDVPYIVYTQDMYNEFKEEYVKENNKWIAKTGLDFCNLCSKNIWKYIKIMCYKHNIDKVILGNKIYASLNPYVSSIKRIRVSDNDIKNIYSLNLLFALNINTQRQREILNLLSWKNPNLKGYTSNCLIPGFTEHPRTEKIRTDSDAGYIEMELRSGIYTKDEAEKLILNKVYSDNSEEIDLFLKYVY